MSRSASPKWRPRSTGAETAPTATVTSASPLVTAGSDFTVTVNASLTSPPRPSAAVTTIRAVPCLLPVTVSSPRSAFTVAAATYARDDAAR